ncbi:unnamed protein product [Auanema sp. JU1783]|nr:unnamed protein product [Auanema sp. JU1783]
MVIEFPWDPSTSVSNLTHNQIGQLCALIKVNDTEVLSDVFSATSHSVHHERPAPYIVWSVGLLFVTLINMCALIGIGVMKYLTKNVYNQVITLFVGLGVGSLSGSSFYHLLPQAHPSLLEEKDEHGNLTHSYLHIAHTSLLGVYLFFMCDKLIKIILEMRKRKRQQSGTHAIDKVGSALLGLEHGTCEKTKLACEEAAAIEMMQLETTAGKSMGDQAHGICVHDHSMTFEAGDSAIAAVAWMIIFGDGFHNFIDGISLGAAFAESTHSGISISIAVLCEEFPHELGDVAILVAAGMTLRQALLYNLLSAVTCYIGFAIGVGIGELNEYASQYAFALAGGMFLYISLGCMMPEMRKAMEEALNVSLQRGLYVLFLQSVGVFIGLFLMYYMARYGDAMTV